MADSYPGRMGETEFYFLPDENPAIPLLTDSSRKEIILNGLKKRFDILVYDENHKPWIMVECKAPEVELSEKVLRQVLIYNQSVPVSYFVITNGKKTHWVGGKQKEK
jgi:hypothetical protein